MNIDFPYGFDGTGRTATMPDPDGHIRDLIEQVLFTAPGERVMRPDFGSGLLALTFEPNSVAIAATTQALVQGALQYWLGHLIAVQDVTVESVDGALRTTVSYVVLRDQARRRDQFTAPGALP
jgi:phage baseplate assembly protein W